MLGTPSTFARGEAVHERVGGIPVDQVEGRFGETEYREDMMRGSPVLADALTSDVFVE